MKADERAMLLYIFEHGDCSLIDYPMNEKRKAYLCEKWTARGWYDYGVTARSGWLTADGKEIARQIKAEELIPELNRSRE